MCGLEELHGIWPHGHVDVVDAFLIPIMRTKVTPTEQLPVPSVVKAKTMKPGNSFHQFQTIMYFEA